MYDREFIKKGVFLTLDCPVDRPLKIFMRPKPKPRPVRYGEQPFAEVSERLNEARERLAKLLADVRNARRH